MSGHLAGRTGLPVLGTHMAMQHVRRPGREQAKDQQHCDRSFLTVQVTHGRHSSGAMPDLSSRLSRQVPDPSFELAKKPLLARVASSARSQKASSSISTGAGWRIMAFVAINALRDNLRAVHPLLWAVAAVFRLAFSPLAVRR
jgi:hypothetical protein